MLTRNTNFVSYLQKGADDIPFDLRHERHIVYGASITSLKSKLTIDLAALKVELSARENPISVQLARIEADLSKTKFSRTATANVSRYTK